MSELKEKALEERVQEVNLLYLLLWQPMHLYNLKWQQQNQWLETAQEKQKLVEWRR